MSLPTCSKCGTRCQGSYTTRVYAEKKGGGGRREEIICDTCIVGEQVAEYLKSGYVSSSFWLTASLEVQVVGYGRECRWPGHLEVFRKVVGGMEEVKQACKRFESTVWFKGVQELVRKASGGLSYKSAELEVLVLCSAGRCMLTLQHGDRDVTLITAEDETRPVMGIQGIHSTPSEAISLINKATQAWSEGTLKLNPDQAVSFF